MGRTEDPQLYLRGWVLLSAVPNFVPTLKLAGVGKKSAATVEARVNTESCSSSLASAICR